MHRTSRRWLDVVGFLAALVTGLGGFIAFNVFDTVFGVPEAIVGLVAWMALTVFVFRRAPRAREEHDA
jgi:uncharacterized membrane protein YuzA (DUF378 family)